MDTAPPGLWDRLWDALKWVMGVISVFALMLWRGLEGRVNELEKSDDINAEVSADHATDLAVLRSRFDGLENQVKDHREETRDGFAAVLQRLDAIYVPPKTRQRKR